MQLRDEILLSLIAELDGLIAIADDMGEDCPEGLSGGLRIVQKLLAYSVQPEEWGRFMQYFETSVKPKWKGWFHGLDQREEDENGDCRECH